MYIFQCLYSIYRQNDGRFRVRFKIYYKESENENLNWTNFDYEDYIYKKIEVKNIIS